MTEKTIRKVALAASAICFVWVPMVSIGTNYHPGFLHHVWIWENLGGADDFRVDLPIIGCEIIAIWLAYYLAKSFDTN